MSDDADYNFDSQASQYPDAYLPCRDYGHVWRPLTVARLDGGYFERVLECGQCSTQRSQVLDPNGYVEGGRYGYPEQYLMKGVGRMTREHRATFRLASLAQMTRGSKI